MKHLYYIIENVKNTDKQGLQGTRIFEIPLDFPFLNVGDGPYNSLRGLKRNSLIFKRLKANDAKRARKIEENLITPVDKIFTEPNSSYSMDFINIYLHATKGRVVKGNVSGIHFYNPKKVKIISEELVDISTGVWKAIIKYFDSNTKKWILKKIPSTFFPKDWDRNKLFHECDFAYKKMVKKPNTHHVYISKTASDIPVEIIMKKDKLVSIYPVNIEHHL